MNRRGLEISMANPVNETISYQTHYVAESRGEGGAAQGSWGRGGRCQAKGIPGLGKASGHGAGRGAGQLPSPAHYAARQRGLYFYFRAELSITRVTFTTK